MTQLNRIEERVESLDGRLRGVEGALGTLDGKIDKVTSDVRLEIHKEANNQLRWIIGLGVAALLGILGILTALVFQA